MYSGAFLSPDNINYFSIIEGFIDLRIDMCIIQKNVPNNTGQETRHESEETD